MEIDFLYLAQVMWPIFFLIMVQTNQSPFLAKLPVNIVSVEIRQVPTSDVRYLMSVGPCIVW